jgi:sigma-B regulation protein RsbU (phosphoserine phosphatase)
MTRLRIFYLKNQMLIGNAVANIVGVNVVEMISHRSISPPPPEAMAIYARVDAVFLPLSFMGVFIATVVYELPIRRFLSRRCQKTAASERQPDVSARRRLLNEPFFLIAIDLLVWIVAAVVYTLAIHRSPFSPALVVGIFFRTVFVGIITVTIAFFVLEWRLQRSLVPVLFPQGGLYAIRGVLRIRIGTRLAALITAANLIPFLAFLLIVQRTVRSELPPDQLLHQLRVTIATNSIVFITVGAVLTVLVSINLTRPFGNIIQVLKNVHSGRLDRRVSVRSNDEIGYVGDVINEMTSGLREREDMRRSLELARKVQQDLLPKTAPQSMGLDIAGRSIYCDQTGGDYFDYIPITGAGGQRVGLLVGDVSGHGISSALLMATARAFLRLRSFLPGGLAQVVNDVNAQLCRDVKESGQFMTLFFLVIDPGLRVLKWVRAGHDPAVLYDPRRDCFEELRGRGMALGVDETWHYEEEQRSGLERGQIIVIGTDGIWESRNPAGQMFGKAALFDVIRNHALSSAQDILNAIVDALRTFQAGARTEDDITLVVVRVRHADGEGDGRHWKPKP